MFSLSDQRQHFDHVLLVAFTNSGNDTAALQSIEAKAVLLLFAGIDLFDHPFPCGSQPGRVGRQLRSA